jgi:hypothetical protein
MVLWTHQLLFHADGINLLGDNINTIKGNTETVLGSRNSEKLKYIIIRRHQNSGQSWNLWTASESSEGMEKFIYLGTTLTNQNDIRDEIKLGLTYTNEKQVFI